MLEHRGLSLGLFIVLSVLSAIGLLLTATFFTFNVRFRKLRLVRMSSPNLNVLITVGGLLSYICCVLFGLDAVFGDDLTAMTVTCQVRSWLLTLSVTLVFGTMLAKSWRVHRIFHKAGTQRVVIKDEKLVAIVAVLVCADVIILSLWHGFDSLKAEIMPVAFWKQVSGNASWTAVTVVGCSSQYTPVWMSVLFLYKAGLLTAGVCLSWATRHVLLPSMNEARFTILTTFTTTILCSIAAALSVILRSTPDAAQACLAGAVWISTTTSLILVFLPKIRLVMTRKDTKIFRHSLKLTPTGELPPSDNPDHVHPELCRLMTENTVLKKSLTERDDAIQSLQDHLGSAQAKLRQMADEAEMKNDSGLDFEVSSAASSQNEEHNERTIYVKPKTSPEKSEIIETRRQSRCSIDTTPDSDSNLNSIHSDKSVTRSRLAALRDSIAEDLQNAHSFTSNLRDSICKDFGHVSFNELTSTEAALLCARSRKGLVGSIAESYNFGPDGDDWSYLQQFLQVELPRQPLRQPAKQYGPSNRNSTSEIPDGLILADEVYPELPKRDRVRPVRSKSARRTRDQPDGSSFNYITPTKRRTKARDNVYVIHNPNAKHMVTSCLAQKQCLRTANGTMCFEVLDSFV